MPRCEDYPCCGHEDGDCPRIDDEGVEHWRCVGGCGEELPRNARSSICADCQRRMFRDENYDYYDNGGHEPDDIDDDVEEDEA
jgi:hypothetical protein